MSELKLPEQNETKDISDVARQEIKPKTSMTADQAKDFWDSKFGSSNEERHEGVSSDIKDGLENNQYPKTEYIDGHNMHYDDNGVLYRIDNDLQPNKEYMLNGYEYKTDDQGRIIEASGKLHMKERSNYKQIKDSLHEIGKGDEIEGVDDKGHLIGDQFDGKSSLANAVPQNFRVNRGEYASLENRLAEKVKIGDDVEVKVEPIYDEDSHRPSAISYTYSINGEVSVQIFLNEEE